MKQMKDITVEPLFKNHKKTLYTLIEDSEVVLVFEHNNTGLEKLSMFQQTGDSPAFLNVM
jgi:hypothetical protein